MSLLPRIDVDYYDDGNIKRETWMKNGILHREGDLPAEIIYSNLIINDIVGVCLKFSTYNWYKFGKRKRKKNLPTSVINKLDGKYINKIWHVKNKIIYIEKCSKSTSTKAWFSDNLYHRENGPALIIIEDKSPLYIYSNRFVKKHALYNPYYTHHKPNKLPKPIKITYENKKSKVIQINEYWLHHGNYLNRPKVVDIYIRHIYNAINYITEKGVIKIITNYLL